MAAILSWRRSVKECWGHQQDESGNFSGGLLQPNCYFCVLIQISQMFIPKGPSDNKSSLMQVIMAWGQNRWQAITH